MVDYTKDEGISMDVSRGRRGDNVNYLGKVKDDDINSWDGSREIDMDDFSRGKGRVQMYL